MRSSVSGYHETTLPWQSDAGGGPTLRGRRLDGPQTMLHFVHGNGFCGGVYWPLLQELVPEYGLFCHDIEAHGQSDAPARFSGTRAIRQRFMPVIAEQQLPTGQLIGMGHSYGAAQTLCAAAENPQLFRALVLLDPILLPPLHFAGTRLLAAAGRNPPSRGARRRRDRWDSRQRAWERLHDRGIYHGWRDDAFDCFIEYATRDDESGQRVLSCPKWMEAEIFDHPTYPWRALPRVQCPMLIVFGDNSYPFLKGAERRVRERHASADVRTQAGGHCFMLEDPVTTAETIRDFLSAHKL